MSTKIRIIACVAVVILFSDAAFCRDLADDWHDFLRSMEVDRLDEAARYGQRIIDGGAESRELIELSSQNPNYRILFEKYAGSPELERIIGALAEIIDQNKLVVLSAYWKDFLQTTVVGRLDLARGFAQKIINLSPDPKQVLALSEKDQNGYQLLQKLHADSEQLREVSGKILDIIEQGRFLRRTDARIIKQEIKRLSTTLRGEIAAQRRLKNSGEYAIPHMLNALADESRKNEFANITRTLPMIGRSAVRPLVTALDTDNVAVKAEIIRALGQIGYRQSLGYLKYVVEKDESAQLRTLAQQAIEKIDPSVLKLGSSELFFQLAEAYYNHAESLAPSTEFDFGNIWFWDKSVDALVREEVDKGYFNELLSMRACEWALKADPDTGKAIALWLAAFFKAESAGVQQPRYFGPGHADAMTYATTAGPEYLHQALERAIQEKNAYVSLGVVEALAANAGEKSLLYRIGTQQPLVKALSFDDRAVRYSAAIAIGQAGPVSEFMGSRLIVENLAEAVSGDGLEQLGRELTDIYATRAINVMLKLAVTRNSIVDLSEAKEALIAATKSSREQIQNTAGQVLARLPSPDAQRAIAQTALLESNLPSVRITAFNSLAISAKLNAKLLTPKQIDAIYALISSEKTEPQLRSAAASAYGALNLPSKRVKDLILSQSKT